MLALCNHSLVYRVDTNSINPVSQGRLTGQKPCIHAGLSRFDGHSHSMVAGGFGVMADSQSLNLAQPVEDGAGLKVPRRSTVPQGDVGSMSGAVDGSIVRLNSATTVELETLPGIGPTLAGRIVDYRNRHGAFRRIEDIQEVPGIGAGRFERMKGRLAL